MADVDDIIDYIRSLKKGFDKDLFQSKVDELAYVADTLGLDYDDFHTLYKVWLNLSIPITKWVSFGSCLVPPDIVEQRTIEYSLRWILANMQNQANFSRIGFLLDWLTAAMESESIDMVSLDKGYEVFYTLLTQEVLTVHAMKLVYTLTKPLDVTRRRVLELLTYVKKREDKKSKVRHLHVLLGLFKSYKPDCVPEDIPAVSILTAFKKLHVNLVNRFKKTQERRNRQRTHKQQLLWTNPINSERGRNKKADPLVPSVEFFNVDKESIKTVKDFSDPASMLHYGLQHVICRPTRIRSFLCNTAGQILLTILSNTHQAFLSHDLHHLLNNCFLEVSPYSYKEKQYLLRTLALFQRTLAQGIPVVTRFLAQYLTLWNETDYFPEICDLVEWVSADSPEHVQHIAQTLCTIYARAQPIEQCALLRTLTNMYTNLIYSSGKSRQHFLNTPPSPANYAALLPSLAQIIVTTTDLGLQVDPEDYRMAYTCLQSSLRRGRAEVPRGTTTLPSPLTLSLPVLGTSALLVEDTAELMLLYRTIISSSKNEHSSSNEEYIEILSRYMTDLLNCLYGEKMLTERQNGLIFEKMDEKVVEKLNYLIPDVNSKLSLRNHLAFAPHALLNLVDAGYANDYMTNKMLYDTVIVQKFKSLSRFLKKALR